MGVSGEGGGLVGYWLGEVEGEKVEEGEKECGGLEWAWGEVAVKRVASTAERDIASFLGGVFGGRIGGFVGGWFGGKEGGRGDGVVVGLVIWSMYVCTKSLSRERNLEEFEREVRDDELEC